MSKRMLWVEVSKDTLSFFKGAGVPDDLESGSWDAMWGYDTTISRKEFARWSGVTFKKPGIYGLEVKLAVIKKVRTVISKDYVAAERTTRKHTVEDV